MKCCKWTKGWCMWLDTNITQWIQQHSDLLNITTQLYFKYFYRLHRLNRAFLVLLITQCFYTKLNSPNSTLTALYLSDTLTLMDMQADRATLRLADSCLCPTSCFDANSCLGKVKFNLKLLSEWLSVGGAGWMKLGSELFSSLNL